MAYEILKSIVDAEEQALKMKQQAVADAQTLKTQANAQSTILLDNIRKEGLQSIENAAEQAVEDSVMAIQGIRRDAEESCSKIRSQAAGKKEEAIQAIIGKVVGTYGSC